MQEYAFLLDLPADVEVSIGRIEAQVEIERIEVARDRKNQPFDHRSSVIWLRQVRRLIAHDMIRQLLKLPAHTKINRSNYGAPMIETIRDHDPAVSIAYSGDSVFVAVGKSAIGIDAELVPARFCLLDTLPHFCTPQEIAAIDQLDIQKRNFAALRLWTAKEAFVKMIGTGFRINPLSLNVEIVEGQLDGQKSLLSLHSSGKAARIISCCLSEIPNIINPLLHDHNPSSAMLALAMEDNGDHIFKDHVRKR